MRLRKYNGSLRWLSLFTGTVLLNGYSSALSDPKGQIGLEQHSPILTASGLTLIVAIPAISMTIDFAWRHCANNKDVRCSPNQSHSDKVETVVWTVPILIIIFLMVLTWKATHTLEPSKLLTRGKKPITTEMVSMDQRWSFIYPEQGIATMNEIAFPASTPVYFKVTSNSVMNSFFIPYLGSQIYAMAGMQARLHLIASEPGTCGGIPASYSGPGFSGMKFKAIATPDRVAFDQWVAKARRSPNSMSDMTAFEKLATPSRYNQVEYFSDVKPGLFTDAISKSMAHGESMDVTQPGGEHGAYEGIESMDMNHAESIH